MKDKRQYTAPALEDIHIVTPHLLTMSGHFSDEITDGDANARGFDFDDDEWDD